MLEKIKNADRTVIASVVIVLLVVLGIGLTNNGSEQLNDQEKVVAQENNGDTQQSEEQSAQTAEEAKALYSYTAQPGDSYSKMARKAVQTYGILNNVSLSEAQIVAAETKLTQGAGSPELSVSQTVELNADDIAKVVEEVQKMDDTTEAMWATYVPYVNFNTDGVGEAQA